MHKITIAEFTMNSIQVTRKQEAPLSLA